MADNISLLISDEDSGSRIDKLLSGIYSEVSRSHLQNLIKDGKILVNGDVVKPSYITKLDDEIFIESVENKAIEILPQNIELDILFEDDSLLIINKPKEMVVHPAAGHFKNTLVNALLYHCKDKLSNVNGILRPGIVHRIDKNTTGALIVCKDNATHNFIAEQLKEHSVSRRYIGLIKGTVDEANGVIDAPIGRDIKNRLRMAIDYQNGKNAVTKYDTIQLLDRASLMSFRLRTGRTHQIRAHMSGIGHPLLGDSLYGENEYTRITREQCLHAEMIGFIHPKTHDYMEFHAPIPGYFIKLYNKLGGNLTTEMICDE